MIVTKTPLRIPLAGGLTDLKFYATQFGGTTVSATIDKYVYVTLKDSIDDNFNVRYHDVYERRSHADGIRHDLIRETLRLTDLDDTPLEISIQVDLAGESGLGSSGAITVGLLHAMRFYRGEKAEAYDLALDAAHIEVDILEGASGYHDPSICALGGLKRIDYTSQGAAMTVAARNIELSSDSLESFGNSLLFFYSGRHGRTKPSLDLLTSRFDEAVPVLHEIKELAGQLEEAFGHGDLKAIGEAIGHMQELKQRLPGNFVDDYVSDVTSRVRDAGGYAQLPGGKISAFVIVCCPEERQGAVRGALADLREVRFELDPDGTRATVV